MSAASETLADLVPVFAALGDATRLALVGKLADGAPRSIADLARGEALSRQGVTKHLRVLEDAGLVTSTRRGRATTFEVQAETLSAAARRLEAISRQWDDALARLRSHVEG